MSSLAFQALIGHFDDLNRAHRSVLKAQQQVELLTPLVSDCHRHTVLLKGVASLQCRDSLRSYFAGLQIGAGGETPCQPVRRMGQGRCPGQPALIREEQSRNIDELKRAISDNGVTDSSALRPISAKRNRYARPDRPSQNAMLTWRPIW